MNKLTIDYFKNYKFPHSLKLSNKDNLLAYSLTSVNMEENKYDTNIWIYNLDQDKHYQLTNSNKDGAFQFLDNGHILFSSARQAKENFSRYYEISPFGGEAKEFFDLELMVSQLGQIDEDNFLLLGGKASEESDFHQIDVLPFWLNSAGFIYDQESNLYIYNKKEDKLEELTKKPLNISSFKLNKARNLALVSYDEYDSIMPMTNKLGIYDLEKRELKDISPMEFSYRFYDWMGDKIVFTGTDMKKHGLNEDSLIYTINHDGSGLEMLNDEDFDLAFYNSVGTDSRYGGGSEAKVLGDDYYFVTTEFDNSYLRKINLDGSLEKVIDGEGTVEMFDIKDDKLAYIAMRDLDLAEIYLREDGKDRKLTNFSQVLEDISLSPIEKFDFKNDGIDLEGYLIKPVDFDPAKKYPGVLEIHGGPKTAFGSIFHHEMQVLANLGYFVFYTNPRGSSGRSVAFSDIRGKYGTIDYDDLMAFTDQVLERYEQIDQDNLAVLGGSYGGFMTNWIIGHTDRFKVANTQRSISNWTSFYGVSDIGYYFAQDQNNSNPWNDFDLLWESSPLKHLNKAKTPTLVIHSDEDYRCPLEQGMQVFNALKTNDVDTRMVIFKGENHELSRSGKPKSRIKRMEEIIDWFDKYIDRK